MATKPAAKSTDAVNKFLASDKTIKDLSREELADLDEELNDLGEGDKEHWLKPVVETELRGRVSG